MHLLLEDVVKAYGKKSVLDHASYTFEEGKIYALLGRNGAGKTTLFNCINEDTDYEGTIVLDEGKKILPDDIGYVLSEPVVPDFLTGREFLKFFLEVHGHTDAEKETDEILSAIGLETDDANRLMKEYSHGMKNKIQMAVIFAMKPQILLLDEPLTSLDVVASEEMKDMLKGMKEGRIIILSTHILDLAEDLCDEIVLLKDGKLSAAGSTDDEAIREKILSALMEN